MAYLPLDTVKMFVDLFQVIYLRDYRVEKKDIPGDEFSKIFILNDDLILLVDIRKDDRAMPLNAKELFKKTHGRGNRFVRIPSPEADYFVLDIYELTPNSIGFEFVYREFIDRLEMLTGMHPLEFDITYNRFNGWSRKYWDKETPAVPEQIDKIMPELKLKERYEKWQGVKYNFVILEYRKDKKTSYFAVAYTKSTPENYLTRLKSFFLKKNAFSSEIRGGYTFSENIKKDKLKTKNLKLKKLYYLAQTKNFREKDDVWKYADKLLEKIETGKIDSSYMQPVATYPEKKEKELEVDISRFKDTQNMWFSDTLDGKRTTLFERSMNELRSHEIIHNCMWYMFPRLQEPGWDNLSNGQGFENIDEAKAFLRDPGLRKNLEKTLKLVASMSKEEFGETFASDDLEYWVNSSVSIFALLDKEGKVFQKIIKKFFDGRISKYVSEEYGKYLDTK